MAIIFTSLAEVDLLRQMVAATPEDQECSVSVDYFADGHNGPGLYAWETDCSDEGCMFLGEEKEEK